jgi:hypothetical protein
MAAGSGVEQGRGGCGAERMRGRGGGGDGAEEEAAGGGRHDLSGELWCSGG